mgnify:CR=1 FL=1
MFIHLLERSQRSTNLLQCPACRSVLSESDGDIDDASAAGSSVRLAVAATSPAPTHLGEREIFHRHLSPRRVDLQRAEQTVTDRVRVTEGSA